MANRVWATTNGFSLIPVARSPRGRKSGNYVIDATVSVRFTREVRTIAILLFPGCMALDVVGPHDVFNAANTALDELGRRSARYQVQTVASATGPVRGQHGLALHADHTWSTLTFGDAEHSQIDTLLIPGGTGFEQVLTDHVMMSEIVQAASGARRIASVCTGSFILAAAGLCTGKRVTTHWALAAQLAERFPLVDVDPDAIFVNDGRLWTSAGVTAGIDLALALVENDCGSDVATLIARHLVVYLRRPGGQTQYSAPTWSRTSELQPIRSACDLVHAEPGADLSVDRLAAHVGLSGRHFARLFRSETGESPARYVEQVRLDAARSLLETEALGLDAIATQLGFGSAETLRRVFQRRLGVSPTSYRRQFARLSPMT